MSLDRRIVSILYYNNIFDVNNVEEFIGEKDNFYEIKIDGEIRKLEIPGKEYIYEYLIDINDDTLEKRIFSIPIGAITRQEAEDNIKIMKEYKNETFEDESFEEIKLPTKQYIENKLIELEKNYNNISHLEKTDDQIEISGKSNLVFESFEEELEKTEIEKNKIFEKSKRSPKISDKKIKIVDPKKIDDDLDDFINLM